LKNVRAQIITTSDYEGGSLQHALTLAHVLASVGVETQFVNLRPPVNAGACRALAADSIRLINTSPDKLPHADLSLVVDLLELPCREAARALAKREDRLILVPTGYLFDCQSIGLSRAAEALWFVSWDQAAHSRTHWNMAKQIEVVRCAVDTDRFRPSNDTLSSDTWVLSRHSRDRPEKYSQDIFFVLNRLGDSHRVRLRMLGAVETLGSPPDDRVQCYSQGARDVAQFLRESHIWFFSHASYWRESACIAMLEAMACGLPVVVPNTGGLREYVRHGKTGFLCNDAEEYIQFIRLLFDQPRLYQRMGLNARRFVENHHSLRTLSQQVLELLDLK
jgi:glycosyltransferase involved in cell wall biosynthesis